MIKGSGLGISVQNSFLTASIAFSFHTVGVKLVVPCVLENDILLILLSSPTPSCKDCSSAILHGSIIPNFWGYEGILPSFIRLCRNEFRFSLQQFLLPSFILIQSRLLISWFFIFLALPSNMILLSLCIPSFHFSIFLLIADRI